MLSAAATNVAANATTVSGDDSSAGSGRGHCVGQPAVSSSQLRGQWLASEKKCAVLADLHTFYAI